MKPVIHFLAITSAALKREDTDKSPTIRHPVVFLRPHQEFSNQWTLSTRSKQPPCRFYRRIISFYRRTGIFPLTKQSRSSRGTIPWCCSPLSKHCDVRRKSWGGN